MLLLHVHTVVAHVAPSRPGNLESLHPGVYHIEMIHREEGENGRILMDQGLFDLPVKSEALLGG